MILAEFCCVFAEIILSLFYFIFFPCGGRGCGGSADCTCVFSAFFFAADLYSRDFGSVFSCLRRASIVVILAQCFCTYGEPLNNVI